MTGTMTTATMHATRVVVERRAEQARLLRLARLAEDLAEAFAALPPLPDLTRLVDGPRSRGCELAACGAAADLRADSQAAQVEHDAAEGQLLDRDCPGWEADDEFGGVEWRIDRDADGRICYVAARVGFTPGGGHPYRISPACRRLYADICLAGSEEALRYRLAGDASAAMEV